MERLRGGDGIGALETVPVWFDTEAWELGAVLGNFANASLNVGVWELVQLAVYFWKGKGHVQIGMMEDQLLLYC